MKRLLILLFFSMSMIACDNASLITREAIQDTAGCYESIEITDDMYIISLDRNCVDTELSIPPPVPASEPTVINRDWELIATLERDIRQKHWHEFYVQKDIEPKILNAFRDGKDLFFEIVDSDSFVKTDFYLIQPNPPTGWVNRFYPSSGWFDHWGPEKATAFAVPVDRSNPGLVISLDPGFPGSEFHHPDNRNKKWVGGEVEFRTKLIPEKKTNLDWAAVQGYPPHIKDGIVLKVYVR